MFVTYHNILLGVYFTHSHKHKITIITFRGNFGIIPVIQIFFLCFHRLTKPTTITPAVMTKPLSAENVLRLILLPCIIFMADLFPWLYVEKFWSTELMLFCFRLGVIGRSIGIIISHAVNAVFYIW